MADSTPKLGLSARMVAVLGLAFAAVACGGLLPAIALDSGFADAMVRVSDTAYWGQMPFLCLAAVILLITRPGIDRRRRVREAWVVTVAMAVVLTGASLINENVVKPAIGIPRPNIVALAEDGVLGPGISDGDAFYAFGSKDDRRALLADRLTPSTVPDLSDRVRAHWIHEAGYSLPSGHATAAMTFATLWVGLGLLWLGRWRKAVATVAFPAWAVGVAHSRLFLEVHTAPDVIVGTLVGMGLGIGTLLVLRRAVPATR